jgi:hypothetical protein
VLLKLTLQETLEDDMSELEEDFALEEARADSLLDIVVEVAVAAARFTADEHGTEAPTP